MTRCERWLGASVIALGALWLAGCAEPPPAEALAQHAATFGRFCTDCHNGAEAAGDLSLENVTPERVAANPEIFEKDRFRLSQGFRRHGSSFKLRGTGDSQASRFAQSFGGAFYSVFSH